MDGHLAADPLVVTAFRDGHGRVEIGGRVELVAAGSFDDVRALLRERIASEAARRPTPLTVTFVVPGREPTTWLVDPSGAAVRSGPRPVRRPRRALTVAVVAGVVALVATAAAVVAYAVSVGASHEKAGPSAPATTALRATGGIPPVRPAAVRHTHLRVIPTAPATGPLRLVVSADRWPAVVTLRVSRAGTPLATRRLPLDRDGAPVVVVFPHAYAGAYSWRATAYGAPAVTGGVRIAPPPETSPVTSPGATQETTATPVSTAATSTSAAEDVSSTPAAPATGGTSTSGPKHPSKPHPADPPRGPVDPTAQKPPPQPVG